MSRRSELMEIRLQKDRLLERNKRLREETSGQLVQLSFYAELAGRLLSYLTGLLSFGRRRRRSGVLLSSRRPRRRFGFVSPRKRWFRSRARRR